MASWYRLIWWVTGKMPMVQLRRYCGVGGNEMTALDLGLAERFSPDTICRQTTSSCSSLPEAIDLAKSMGAVACEKPAPTRDRLGLVVGEDGELGRRFPAQARY